MRLKNIHKRIIRSIKFSTRSVGDIYKDLTLYVNPTHLGINAFNFTEAIEKLIREGLITKEHILKKDVCTLTDDGLKELLTLLDKLKG